MTEQQDTVRYAEIVGFPAYRACEDGLNAWVESRWQRNGRASFLGDTWRRVVPVRNRKRLRIALSAPGKTAQRFLHTIILSAFVGPCPAGMQCCHADDNPHNNALSNLRWDTQKANAADATRNGRRAMGDEHYSRKRPDLLPRGETHGCVKLSAESVREVRRRYLAGEHSQRKIASDFGVSQSLVSYIVRGAGWKHLGDELLDRGLIREPEEAAS